MVGTGGQFSVGGNSERSTPVGMISRRSLGIDIHPRTVGTLRKRVNWIGDSGARVTGKGGLPDGVWSLYHDVRAKLAPAPVS